MSWKSSRPESSTYSTSSSTAARLRALLGRQQHHLGALAGDVAGGDDARDRELRHEADAHRAGRATGTSRSCRRAAPARCRRPRRRARRQQDLPAGRDRGLGELQLAHVALREEDAVVDVARLALPGQHEDALLAARHEAVRERRAQLARGLVGQEAPRLVEQALARRARPRRRPGPSRTGPAAATSPITPSWSSPPSILTRLDGAVGRAHAALDLRGLERRARPAPRSSARARRCRARSRSSCRRR